MGLFSINTLSTLATNASDSARRTFRLAMQIFGFLDRVNINSWTKQATNSLTSGGYFTDTNEVRIHYTDSNGGNREGVLGSIPVGHGLWIAGSVFIVELLTPSTNYVTFRGYWREGIEDTTATGSNATIGTINHELRFGLYTRYGDIVEAPEFSSADDLVLLPYDASRTHDNSTVVLPTNYADYSGVLFMIEEGGTEIVKYIPISLLTSVSTLSNIGLQRRGFDWDRGTRTLQPTNGAAVFEYVVLQKIQGEKGDPGTVYTYTEISNASQIPASPVVGDVIRAIGAISASIPSTVVGRDGSTTETTIGIGDEYRWSGAVWWKIGDGVGAGGVSDTDTHYAVTSVNAVGDIPASPGVGDVIRIATAISASIPSTVKGRDGTTTETSLSVGNEYRFHGTNWIKIGDGVGAGGVTDTDTHYAFTEVGAVSAIPASPATGDVVRISTAITASIPATFKGLDGTTTETSLDVGNQYRWNGTNWLKIGDGEGEFLRSTTLGVWNRETGASPVAGRYYSNNTTISIHNENQASQNKRTDLSAITAGDGIEVGSRRFVVTGVDTSESSSYVRFTGRWTAGGADNTATNSNATIRKLEYARTAYIGEEVDALTLQTSDQEGRIDSLEATPSGGTTSEADVIGAEIARSSIALPTAAQTTDFTTAWTVTTAVSGVTTDGGILRLPSLIPADNVLGLYVLGYEGDTKVSDAFFEWGAKDPDSSSGQITYGAKPVKFGNGEIVMADYYHDNTNGDSLKLTGIGRVLPTGARVYVHLAVAANVSQSGNQQQQQSGVTYVTPNIAQLKQWTRSATRPDLPGEASIQSVDGTLSGFPSSGWFTVVPVGDDPLWFATATLNRSSAGTWSPSGTWTMHSSDSVLIEFYDASDNMWHSTPGTNDTRVRIWTTTGWEVIPLANQRLIASLTLTDNWVQLVDPLSVSEIEEVRNVIVHVKDGDHEFTASMTALALWGNLSDITEAVPDLSNFGNRTSKTAVVAWETSAINGIQIIGFAGVDRARAGIFFRAFKNSSNELTHLVAHNRFGFATASGTLEVYLEY